LICITFGNCPLGLTNPPATLENATECVCNDGYTLNPFTTLTANTCTCSTANGLTVLINSNSSYCCPAGATVSNGKCGCDPSLNYYRINDSSSKNWVCVINNMCSTANNAKITGSGFNTAFCQCNSGFIPTVTITSSTRQWSCACPTGWTA